MVGEIRKLVFLEGVTVAAPESTSASVSSLAVYDDDADFVTNEGAASLGSIYLNSTTGKIRYYTDAWKNAGEEFRAGSIALTTGDSSKTIVFVTAFDDDSYIPVIGIESSDSDPIFLSWVLKNKTVNGFDIILNAEVDSDNYKINYRVGEAQ